MKSKYIEPNTEILEIESCRILESSILDVPVYDEEEHPITDAQ